MRGVAGSFARAREVLLNTDGALACGAMPLPHRVHDVQPIDATGVAVVAMATCSCNIFARFATRVEARARLGHRGSASAPPTPLSCSYGLNPTVPRMLAFVRRPCDLR